MDRKEKLEFAAKAGEARSPATAGQKNLKSSKGAPRAAAGGGYGGVSRRPGIRFVFSHKTRTSPDDRQLLNLYALKFSLDGSCLLLTVETPERGFETARLSRPDLILLDLVLPKREGLAPTLNKETGFALLERLKTDPATKTIPVIVFTNLDEETEGNVERAKALGAVDYWVKAKLQPSEVVRKVKEILGRHPPAPAP